MALFPKCIRDDNSIMESQQPSIQMYQRNKAHPQIDTVYTEYLKLYVAMKH